jgi:hypothetical protein
MILELLAVLVTIIDPLKAMALQSKIMARF